MHINLKAKEHKIEECKKLRYLTKFIGLNLVFVTYSLCELKLQDSFYFII